jgi:putative transcriptional regulator
MSKKKVPSLIVDLNEALTEVRQLKQGKVTLRGMKVTPKPVLKVNPKIIKDIRKKLNLSQPLFAMKLRVPESTVKKWEQGSLQPSAASAALIHLIKKYPDTINRLDSLH